MAKLRKCDNCVCQGICKIENAYRTISKDMDRVYDPDGKDSYFSMPELICYRYIYRQPVSRINNSEDSLRSNDLIEEEANKNGRIERQR